MRYVEFREAGLKRHRERVSKHRFPPPQRGMASCSVAPAPTAVSPGTNGRFRPALRRAGRKLRRPQQGKGRVRETAQGCRPPPNVQRSFLRHWAVEVAL